MSPSVLLDTGPLVALLDRRDSRHAWVTNQLKGRVWPMLTCEPVLTEAFFLLKRTTNGKDTLVSMLIDGYVSPSFSFAQNETTFTSDEEIRRHPDVLR